MIIPTRGGDCGARRKQYSAVLSVRGMEATCHHRHADNPCDDGGKSGQAERNVEPSEGSQGGEGE